MHACVLQASETSASASACSTASRQTELNMRMYVASVRACFPFPVQSFILNAPVQIQIRLFCRQNKAGF